MADSPRLENDSLGPVTVEARHYWGAQTQRAVHSFAIGPGSDAHGDRPRTGAHQKGGGAQQRPARCAGRTALRLDRGGL